MQIHLEGNLHYLHNKPGNERIYQRRGCLLLNFTLVQVELVTVLCLNSIRKIKSNHINTIIEYLHNVH